MGRLTKAEEEQSSQWNQRGVESFVQIEIQRERSAGSLVIAGKEIEEHKKVGEARGNVQKCT